MMRDEPTLRAAVELAAWAIALASTAILVLALIAELVRHHNEHSRIVVLADRLVPTPGHRAAVALLAIVSGIVAMAGTQSASADDSLRHWLESPPAHASAPSTSGDAEGPSTPAPDSPPSNTPPPTTPAVPIATPAVESIPAIPNASATVPSSGVARPASARPAFSVSDPRPAPVVGPTPAPPSTVPAPGPPTTVLAPIPAADPGPAEAPAPAAAATPSAMVQVRPGDCLWSIAAQALGANPTNADVDRSWRAIYAANRTAIGTDPNLIHPGLILTLPPLTVTP